MYQPIPLFDASQYGESVLHVEIPKTRNPEIAEMFSDIKAGLEFLESRAFFNSKTGLKARSQAAWMRTRLFKLSGVKRWTTNRVRELRIFAMQVQAAFEEINLEDYRINERRCSK